MDIELVAKEIVDSSIKVHRTLGPGLFESTYQQCLSYELRKRGLHVDCEVLLPIYYDGVKIESGYRLDMLIENIVVVENKAVEEFCPVHFTQLLTYLKLGGYHIGFMINWKVDLIKDGIKRIVNPSFQSIGRKIDQKTKI